jgi:hypothetical protein
MRWLMPQHSCSCGLLLTRCCVFAIQHGFRLSARLFFLMEHRVSKLSPKGQVDFFAWRFVSCLRLEQGHRPDADRLLEMTIRKAWGLR